LPPADDSLGSSAPSRARRPPFASDSTRKALAIGGILLVLLLVSLALAGVFSGSSKHSTAGTTTVRTTSSTTKTPAAQPPTTTVKPGDRGAQVRALQRALAQLGYSTGTIDGYYGPATKIAVSKFQQAHQLTADGIVGPATLTALRRATAP
jgi:peptidoglycan hydrolase-like protein with peptidoglycan-binding domain